MDLKPRLRFRKWARRVLAKRCDGSLHQTTEPQKPLCSRRLGSAPAANAALHINHKILQSLRHNNLLSRLHLFHDEVGMCLLHTSHRGEAVAEEAAVAFHVGDADLQ